MGGQVLWLGRGNRWGEKGHPGQWLERAGASGNSWRGSGWQRWVWMCTGGRGQAQQVWASLRVVTGQAWRDLLQRNQMEAGKPLLFCHHSASVNPLVTLQGLLLSLIRADPCRGSGGRAPLLWSCSLMGPPDAEISDLQSPELTKVCSSLKTNDPPNSRKSGLMLRSIKDVTHAHLRPCKKRVLRKRKPEITDNPQR